VTRQRVTGVGVQHLMKAVMNSCGSARRQEGFTVIELMIVVTIAGILLAVSAPAFQDVINRAVVNSQARTLLTAINYARSEAIRRNTPVVLCASSDGSACAAGNWSEGWLVFADNAGAVDSVDTGDEILRVYDGPGSGTTVTFAPVNGDVLPYDGMGFSAASATRQFVICPADNNDDRAQSIDIALTGRAARSRGGTACGS